jgi:hypothetical protein
MNKPISAGAVSGLCQRFIEAMTVRGFSERTRRYYIRIVAGFAAFLGRSPDTMQSLAEGVLGRYSPPHKPAGRRPVTLESDIIEFLRRSRGRLFCNGCLRRKLQITQCERVEIAREAIGAAVGFR